MTPETILPLHSGQHCHLAKPPAPVCDHYYVLYYPSSQGEPSPREEDEMLVIAQQKARELATLHHGDSECWTLIHNGKGPRRARETHVHILLVKDRREKATAYFKLFLKNVIGRLRTRRFTPSGQQHLEANPHLA